MTAIDWGDLFLLFAMAIWCGITVWNGRYQYAKGYLDGERARDEFYALQREKEELVELVEDDADLAELHRREQEKEKQRLFQDEQDSLQRSVKHWKSIGAMTSEELARHGRSIGAMTPEELARLHGKSKGR